MCQAFPCKQTKPNSTSYSEKISTNKKLVFWVYKSDHMIFFYFDWYTVFPLTFNTIENIYFFKKILTIINYISHKTFRKLFENGRNVREQIIHFGTWYWIFFYKYK